MFLLVISRTKESNKEKFFTHKGKRAFRTGDLAYYEDDMVFYLGRNDDQIKMHGYRIELTEISNVIAKHKLVSDAVTVALKRNNEIKKIISFVIMKSITEINVEETIVSFLEKQLPIT